LFGTLVNSYAKNCHPGLRRNWQDYFGAKDCRTQRLSSHLPDDLWHSDWEEKDVPVFREMIQKAHAGEAWISDGNFALATFDIRLPRATMVIWLERSRLLCAWRAIARVFKRGESHRVGKLFVVLRFIWKFNRINWPRIEATRLTFAREVPVVRLRTGRDVEVFLSSYGDGTDYLPPS
jgi:adenylate kinase family enzyme